MPGDPQETDVVRIADLPPGLAADLLEKFGLQLNLVADGEEIPASFWGASEAGLRGQTVLVRGDTPLHSLLHETCHLICMDDARRRVLDRDAGGSDLEEAAVCYLQIVLADELPGIGSGRLMRDMDAWGYSFRLGSTAAWFERDASDAREWLVSHGLITTAGRPSWRLRKD